MAAKSSHRWEVPTLPVRQRSRALSEWLREPCEMAPGFFSDLETDCSQICTLNAAQSMSVGWPCNLNVQVEQVSIYLSLCIAGLEQQLISQGCDISR